MTFKMLQVIYGLHKSSRKLKGLYLTFARHCVDTFFSIIEIRLPHACDPTQLQQEGVTTRDSVRTAPLQRYLAHEKQRPLRTLQWEYAQGHRHLEPYGGSRGVDSFL
jgi:hypothetical protein